MTLDLDNAAASKVAGNNHAQAQRKMIDAGRVLLAADSLGAAMMLKSAVEYSKDRDQFNRLIASFQAVKHMCAEMAAKLEPCRSMIWYAAYAQDHVPEEASLMACLAKSHMQEVSKFVARTATEVHGGMGFTDLWGCIIGSSASEPIASFSAGRKNCAPKRLNCKAGWVNYSAAACNLGKRI